MARTRSATAQDAVATLASGPMPPTTTAAQAGVAIAAPLGHANDALATATLHLGSVSGRAMAYFKRAGFKQQIGIPMAQVEGDVAPQKVTITLHGATWAQPKKLTTEKRLAALTPEARAKVQAAMEKLIAEAEG